MPTNHRDDIGEPAEQQAMSSTIVRLSAFSGLFAIALGLIVLIGWALDIELLKRIRPSFTAMNPLTALALVVSGFAILLARAGRRRAAFTVGGAILLIALAKGAHSVWGGIPIDQLLFTSSLGAGQGVPNAMAPNTNFAFALIGLALMFGAGGRRRFSLVSQGLGASVLAISMFALIGYAFGIDPLNRVGPFIPMALHTGLGLTIVALGLISLTPQYGLVLVLRDNGPAGSMARTILPLAILIPVALGAVRLWGQNAGYYGTEAGVALQVTSNVLVTSVLLTAAILALHRSDRIRQRREQDVTRSEASYRLAENVAQVGHWRMDLPSLQVSWSDEVFGISGIPKGNGVPAAAEILEIYHPDDRRMVRQSVREALRDGRGWEYVVRLRRPDGELRHVRSHGVCEFDGDGSLTGLFGVFADITELANARLRAEDAASAKAAFLANMSHEIRTPLNGVMGFAELLLTSKLDDEQEQHASLILDSGQTLLKLLNDILDVSKIDAGQLEIDREPFDLAHQLRQCARLMNGEADKKGLALTLVVDPELPKYLVGDGLRLRQILLNLLGNAIKFTEFGSIAVEASSNCDTAEPRLRIIVTDTGIGIPEARQASIFEEFVQADVSTARRFGGSGLGLSISRRLAALMGGDIELWSREGEGTRVALTLPMVAAAHPLRRACDPVAEPELLAPSAGAGSPGTRILLAEDLDINQQLITGMLARLGYEVEIACDGNEAIRLAARLLEDPDYYGLILMDMQMPGMDGLAAARAIRQLGGRASQIPIVALTANAYQSDIEDCRNAGMVDHLSKPVSIAALGAALTRWLDAEPTPVHCRRTSDSNKPAVAGKFAKRIKVYLLRLVELQRELPVANCEDRSRLVAEAGTIAHNLAGTAAMFGEPALGDQAAAVEDNLKAEADDGSAWIDQLIDALRQAA